MVRAFASGHDLSEREAAVLASAVAGLAMKETAARLRISVKTVECYWARIYEKTRDRSQREVLARMFRWVAEGRAPGPALAPPDSGDTRTAGRWRNAPLCPYRRDSRGRRK
jgi:DNA-binding CsgD family transcriptional regulator